MKLSICGDVCPMYSNETCAKVLRRIGVTDCALSNNHIFDYGVQGVEDTIQTLSSEGLGYTQLGMLIPNRQQNLTTNFLPTISIVKHIEMCGRNCANFLGNPD